MLHGRSQYAVTFWRNEMSVLINDPAATIKIGGAEKQLSGVAAEFMPVLYIHDAINYMRPERVLYEAIPNGDMLYINYYVHWQDEIAPIKLWHFIYSQIRKVRYGSVNDIEFVEVGITLATGRVDHIAFEWDPACKPDNFAPLHYIVVATRNGDSDSFNVTIRDKSAPAEKIPFFGKRPSVLVPVWNHIYDFYRGEGVMMDDPPLEPMTDALYEEYWMGKRSRPPSRIKFVTK